MSGRVDAASGDAIYMQALLESQQLGRKEQSETRRAAAAAKLASMEVNGAVEAGEYAEMKRERTVAWIKAGVSLAKMGADVGSAAASDPGPEAEADAEVEPKSAKQMWQEKWKSEDLKDPKVQEQGKKDLAEGLAKSAPDVPLQGEDLRREAARRGHDELRTRASDGADALERTKSDARKAAEDERELTEKLLDALSGRVES